MPIFAPGFAQGALDAQTAMRQQAVQAQQQAAQKQAMDYQAWQMQQAQQQAAQQQSADALAMRSMRPPPVAAQPQQPMAPTPGTPSQAPTASPGSPPPTGMGQIPAYRSMAQQTGGAPQGQGQPQGYVSQQVPSVQSQQSQTQGAGQWSLDAVLANLQASNADEGAQYRALQKALPFIQEGDRQRAALLAQSKLDEAERKAQSREKATDAFQQAEIAHWNNMDATSKGRMEKMPNKSGGGSGSGGGGSAAGGQSKAPSDALDALAWKYIDTSTLPYRKGKGGSADPNNAVVERAAALAKSLGMSMQELAAQPAVFKSNAAALSKNQGDITAIEPYNQMVKTNGQILKTLAEKAKLSNSPTLNKSLNWMLTHPSSNTDQTLFLGQMRAFQTEAARVMNNPRLTGQLTDNARSEMDKVINGDMSLETIGGMIDLLSADGDRRVKALEEQSAKLKGQMMGKRAESSTPSGAGPYSDADKEARYQAWKKQHAGQ